MVHNPGAGQPHYPRTDGIKRALEKELGIPSVDIDADHMDARIFSLAQFQVQVDVFMELLPERKGTK